MVPWSFRQPWSQCRGRGIEFFPFYIKYHGRRKAVASLQIVESPSPPPSKLPSPVQETVPHPLYPLACLHGELFPLGNCLPCACRPVSSENFENFRVFWGESSGGFAWHTPSQATWAETPTSRAGSKAKQSFSRPSTFQQRKKGQNMFQHEKKPGHFRDGGVISGILVPSLIHSKRQNGVFQLSFSTPFHGDSFPVGGVGPGRKAACPTPPAGTPVASAGGV